MQNYFQKSIKDRLCIRNKTQWTQKEQLRKQRQTLHLITTQPFCLFATRF
uniref:Uncharacterized protein n=1 Tax=Rhizophora mucronata TaxID=61149 RepID=A0A2P2JFB3_RHIMU